MRHIIECLWWRALAKPSSAAELRYLARLFEMRTCYPLVPQARTAARGMGQELITASSVCVCMCVISPLGDEGDWGEWARIRDEILFLLATMAGCRLFARRSIRTSLHVWNPSQLSWWWGITLLFSPWCVLVKECKNVECDHFNMAPVTWSSVRSSQVLRQHSRATPANILSLTVIVNTVFIDKDRSLIMSQKNIKLTFVTVLKLISRNSCKAFGGWFYSRASMISQHLFVCLRSLTQQHWLNQGVSLGMGTGLLANQWKMVEMFGKPFENPNFCNSYLLILSQRFSIWSWGPTASAHFECRSYLSSVYGTSS